MAKTKKTTLDDLARMVKVGFDETGKRLDGVEKRLDGVEKRLGGGEKRLNGVEGEIESLKEGQERIELRLSNVAYRFELLELQGRVKILEEKMGVKRKD
jgi:archaellum component FlaC